MFFPKITLRTWNKNTQYTKHTNKNRNRNLNLNTTTIKWIYLMIWKRIKWLDGCDEIEWLQSDTLNCSQWINWQHSNTTIATASSSRNMNGAYTRVSIFNTRNGCAGGKADQEDRAKANELVIYVYCIVHCAFVRAIRHQRDAAKKTNGNPIRSQDLKLDLLCYWLMNINQINS